MVVVAPQMEILILQSPETLIIQVRLNIEPLKIKT